MKLDILDYTVYGNQADRESDRFLRQAAEALGHETRVLSLLSDGPVPDLEKRVWLRYDLRSLHDLARIVNLVGVLTAQGHLVFPSARSIALSEDKREMYSALVAAGVPTVQTFAFDKTGPPGIRAVLKPRVGWGGMGMRLVEIGEDLLSQLAEEREGYIWQPFIPHRRTWTVPLAGGKAVAVLEKRTVSGDFRTNARYGEEATETRDPGGAADVAARALEAVGLAAGAADLIETDGRLLVLEVNSAPCLWYDNLPPLALARPMVSCVMARMEEE